MFVRDLAYFVEEGFKSLRHNRFISIVAIATISLALMILGAFLIVYINVHQLTTGWIRQVEITAFLKKGVDPDQVEEIKKKLWENPEIARIQYVSKEDALRRFKSEHPDSVYLLEGLAGNPLPDSFEIGLSEKAKTRKVVNRLVQRIGEIPEFQEIQYGREWTDTLLTFIRVLRFIGLILGGLLAVAILFIIANTVRLTVYARRDELAVMRLIGATNWFIKGPFLLEGLFQGLIGAILSIAMLYATYYLWIPRLRHSAELFFLKELSITFLPPSILFWMAIIGMFLGLLGSLMSLGRFLKI